MTNIEKLALALGLNTEQIKAITGKTEIEIQPIIATITKHLAREINALRMQDVETEEMVKVTDMTDGSKKPFIVTKLLAETSFNDKQRYLIEPIQSELQNTEPKTEPQAPLQTEENTQSPPPDNQQSQGETTSPE